MKKILTKLKNYLVKLIFPNHIKCIFCGDELNQNSYNDTCENCMKFLPHILHYCERCGLPQLEGDTGVCMGCKLNNFEFVKARSVFVYENQIVKLIHGFKYSGKKYLYKPIAKYMAEYFATLDIFPDYITDIPMFKAKEKDRGYNQAKLIAQELSRLTNIPYIDLTLKIKDNKSQASLNFKERRENIKNTFSFNKEHSKAVKGKIILVIDDIFTTGATSNEVCKTIMGGGAKMCYVLTFAHTVVKPDNE